MATPFGIDLGTTRSAIGRVGAWGRAELIDNSLGERLTPSVVWFAPHGTVVGEHAHEMAGAYPEQVIELFKRHMGDPDWTFRTPDGHTHSAVELSSHVLRSLKEDAERATGAPARDVVIAVPAYFGHAGRTATYDAATRAGLNAIDLINEPTAAVLAWMLDSGIEPTDGLLVYDLGGGTFDSVAVRKNGDVLEVVTIGGDNLLGGHDWDRKLTLEFNQRYRRSTGLKDNPTSDPVTDVAWLEKAEYAKKYLASHPEVREHQVVLRYGSWMEAVTVTREQYDKLTENLRTRTIQAALWVLHHAKEKVGLAPKHVLLAGGMSGLPAMTEMLRTTANLEPVPMSRPSYMVAEGAALWALKRVAEQSIHTTDPVDVERFLVREHGLPERFARILSRLKVRHVTSRGFAICYRNRDTKRDALEFLAQAQDELPIAAKWNGVTPADHVTSLELAVYEQTLNRFTTDPRHHIKLGAAVMRDIPPGYPRDTPIEVRFDLDTDQVIRVSFTYPGMAEAATADIYVGDPRSTGNGIAQTRQGKGQVR